MHTNSKRLFDHRSAARASLGCSIWLNQHNHTTSILSFVRSVLDQLSPSGIRDALTQMMVLKHVLDTQIFKSHEAKGIHQLSAFLMSKILSPVGNALVNVLNCFSAFRPFGCSLLCFREFALCFGKFLFISAEKAGVDNLAAIRECGETFKTDIYTHSFLVRCQWLKFYFTREAGIPVANSIAPNGECFYLAFDRAMENNLDRANLERSKPLSRSSNPYCLKVKLSYQP